MTKKKTTAEFIEDAIRIHGDKYDYSKTDYIKSSLKVKIICKEHGEFEQTPEAHIGKQKQGCKKCGYSNNGNKSKKTVEKFIEDVKLIHGDKYDYSKVNYIDSKTKIIIICKIHGDFEQTPNDHIGKRGCKKCGYINISNKYKKTTTEFIEEAIKIHGDKYNYEKVEYIDSKSKVKIICKEHGEFEQTPNAHIGTQKQGCRKCGYINNGINSKKLVEKFIEEAKITHGNNYNYNKVEYINALSKVIISCKIHGDFKQTPNCHIDQKQGCSKCAGCYQPNTEEFIEKAKIIHGNKYDYSKVKYTNSLLKIKIICKIHGEFEQNAHSHIGMMKCGCPKCSGCYKPNTDEFIEKAKLIHDDLYDYSKVNYINSSEKIKIICSKHGEFEQTPNCHINKKQGCPRCCNNQYSSVAITWLNLISKLKNINILHALNVGEYKIPDTNFKADGYCVETNTIYEFHGDYWHGNPKLYDKNLKTHFNKTFGELYEKTLKKEEIIRGLGYNLVVMWEMDFKRINKSIGILQKKFKG
jgi:hypothetical protein